MKAISCWTQKGGVGKTMLTVQLSGYYVSQGKVVTTIDLDPQHSLIDILKQKGDPAITVMSNYPQKNIAMKSDIVLIDFASGAQLAPRTKTVIVPMRPNAIDYRTTRRALKYLHKKNKKIVLVLNDYYAIQSEHRALKKEMESLNEIFICIPHMSIMERSINQGVSVFHKDIQNLYGIRKAKHIIQDLAKLL